MDIIENIKSALRLGAEVGDRFDKFNVRSVARGASEQTMTFQACIDNTCEFCIRSYKELRPCLCFLDPDLLVKCRMYRLELYQKSKAVYRTVSTELEI